MIKHGAYSIYNIQTGQYTPTPLGECKPSEVDLTEHESIRIWDKYAKDGLGWWVDLPPEPTEQEKRDMQIYLHLTAAMELLGIDDD